jgi:hypothetical protein
MDILIDDQASFLRHRAKPGLWLEGIRQPLGHDREKNGAQTLGQIMADLNSAVRNGQDKGILVAIFS